MRAESGFKTFMEGKRTDLVKRLQEKMRLAAEGERFEMAGPLW
jgi:excinuclease UvrABC nuclease subunit